MAGSEQDGVDGADASLFVGATWTLTPTTNTDERAYTLVLRVIRELGAEVVSVVPEHHDELVALVSHVPQLAASTLMDVASANEDDRRTMLRLAAGGFRDMARIAAGHPGIWPDILTTNRVAVLGALDAYVGALCCARARRVGRPRRPARRCSSGRGRAPQPAGRPVDGDRARRAAHSGAGPPGSHRRGDDARRAAGRQRRRLRDRTLRSKGGSGVIVLVVAASDADAFESGLRDLGTTCRGRDSA